jgi:hypothetical protein
MNSHLLVVSGVSIRLLAKKLRRIRCDDDVDALPCRVAAPSQQSDTGYENHLIISYLIRTQVLKLLLLSSG